MATTTGSYNAYGSYIQLNTFDEKEKINPDAKLTFLATLPYRRCLCTKRDTVLVTTVILLFFVILTLSLSLGLPALELKARQYYNPPKHVSSAPIHRFKSATVISDGQMCATIGKNILKDGGHAVDAAIAALFCNGVVNPESMGLGGGFIMVVYIKETGKAEVIDARETAPAAATENMFLGNATASLLGGLAIATPGDLRGYKAAHERYGHLNWTSLLEPSIKLCQDGFPVSRHMAEKLRTISDKIKNNEYMRNAFTNNETGELYKENEIITRPSLAETLTLIAQEGADVLYDGKLTKTLVQDIQNCGGIITEEDFKVYQPKIKEPVIVHLGNPSSKTLYTAPLPGSGLVLSLILQILDGYNITSKMLENLDEQVLLYHRLIEAFKFGFAHRMKLADDDKRFGDLSQLIANLSSREYADSIRKRISDEMTHPPSYYGLQLDNSNDHGTSHISVAAANGDAVSVTSTINTYFGSLCMSPSTGVIFNNDMDDFSSPNITNYFEVPPATVNYIAPGKRPLSSMAPSIIVNDKGNVELITGATGGTRIISLTAQEIMRLLWLNQDIKVATDAPRIHHQLLPDYVYYEKHFPLVFQDKLKTFGHVLKPDNQGSGFLGISKKMELLVNVDYRRNGSVDGF